MARFRCNVCSVPPAMVEFESDTPECQTCGAGGSPYVTALTDIHFLIADPLGLIRCTGGKRYRVACNPKREFLANRFGGDIEIYSASEDTRAVTCPSCMGVPLFQEMRKALPEYSQPPRAAIKG